MVTIIITLLIYIISIIVSYIIGKDRGYNKAMEIRKEELIKLSD